MLPGIAPTNTAIADFCFKGVYEHVNNHRKQAQQHGFIINSVK